MKASYSPSKCKKLLSELRTQGTINFTELDLTKTRLGIPSIHAHARELLEQTSNQLQLSKEELAETDKQLEEVHKDKAKTTHNLDYLNEKRKKLQVEISKAQLVMENKEDVVKTIKSQVKSNEDKIR